MLARRIKSARRGAIKSEISDTLLVSLYVVSASATDGCTIGWDAKNLSGRVSLTTKDGRIFVPRSAKIYVIYQADLKHQALDTADQEYENEQAKSLKSVNKELQELKKDIQIPPEERQARLDRVSALLLKGTDDALAATVDWAAQHSKKSWQVQVIATNEQGVWFREALTPGVYDIIVRADFGNYDAIWAAGLDLRPDKKLDVPLTMPRLYPKKVQ